MKKILIITFVILVIIFEALLLSRNRAETTAIAPVADMPATAGTVAPAPTDATPSTSAATGGRVKGPERKAIAIGASGMVGDTIIKITGLMQDSRCPADVTCIQAGSVGVHTTLTRGKVTTSHDFITGNSPFVFEGYSFEIVGVTPTRTAAGAAIKLSDYRITFEGTPTAKGDNI